MINAKHEEIGTIPFHVDGSTFFDFPYPCKSYYQCSPYEIKFSPGRYFLEIWGASGGDTTWQQITARGGNGGYASGVLTVNNNFKTLYLYLGGSKDQNADGGDQTANPTYNGGGRNVNPPDGPGGGSSDFRTMKGNDWNETLDSRILVAGGGGGGWITTANGIQGLKGGDGGGIYGLPGQGAICESRYGTQNGLSPLQCSVPIGGNIPVNGRGGEGWGSGGGGYCQGASVEDGAGGGGSGFVNTTFIQSYYSYQAITKTTNHHGSGAARITIISIMNCTIKVKQRVFFHYIALFLLHSES